MSFSASDVVKAASLAWDIYRMGWAEEFDASQQYQDFGTDIKSLAENLQNIARVVDNAKTTWRIQSSHLARSRGLPSQRDWDLSSLREILGDYHRTLSDCQKLLEENHEFRKSQNFAYNIEWNMVIQPKVDGLRKRLDSHNAKILILLKPLELSLLSDIHHDLADRIDAVHRSVLHLQGLLIPDVEQAISEQSHVNLITLEVPPDISRKFQIAAEKSHPEIATPGIFPLQAGADAFVVHFESSTRSFRAGNFLNERTPQPKQYLELLKCVWIMASLHQSDALKEQPSDSQWPGYVSQLNEDLSVECQRFVAPAAQRLTAPNMNGLRGDDEFEIWPGEDIGEFISPHKEVCLEEVLRISMPSSAESLKRDMAFYRLDSTKYRIVESVESKNAAVAHRKDFKMDIDLKTVNLTPIYATPSSRPKSLEVLINSGSSQTNPTFQEYKDIYHLQHLLTGYRVYERYDQAMVTVSFFIAGESTAVREHGRLQLWLPKPYGTSSVSESIASGSVSSPSRESGEFTSTSNFGILPRSASPKNTTPSRLSSYSSQSPQNSYRDRMPFSSSPLPPNPSRDRISLDSSKDTITPPRIRTSRLSKRSTQSSEKEVFSRGSSTMHSRQDTVASSGASATSYTMRSRRTPSSIITSSSLASRNTVSSITTISTGVGRANLHAKPSKPLLVIFLKSQDEAAKLAIVAIQIDDNTEVKRERCGCHTSNSKCQTSCIERSEGSLLIQRWDADKGLGSWNLAQLGTEQRKELPANGWHNVQRVLMEFNSLEDRYKFSGSPCRCKPKRLPDLSKCILDGHHGFFGELKQIGSQHLRNYHEEREKAGKRNMVLGSLPEDEL